MRFAVRAIEGQEKALDKVMQDKPAVVLESIQELRELFPQTPATIELVILQHELSRFFGAFCAGFSRANLEVRPTKQGYIQGLLVSLQDTIISKHSTSSSSAPLVLSSWLLTIPAGDEAAHWSIWRNQPRCGSIWCPVQIGPTHKVCLVPGRSRH